MFKGRTEVSIDTSPEVFSYQRTFLPVDIMQTFNNNQNSADLKIIGTGRNNKDYAIKLRTDGNGFVPASEMFCYELANIINIATPGFDILKLRDGSLAFGSVWEGGVSPVKLDNDVFDILNGNVKVEGMKTFFSKVYAFDLFINNIDRHFGNYIFRGSFRGIIAMAYDFSRAWYEIGPFTYEAFDANNKTKVCIDIIKKTDNFDKEEAIRTLQEISDVPKSAIEAILQNIPDNWLDIKFKEEFLDWWGDDDMAIRIEKIKGEV